ncbi:MAG: tyrosine-protein phosphatase [Olegusella sp.]|nr:tyrosine-protein phosphatase [Olegusella sp.]
MTPEEQYGPYGPGRDVAFNTLSNFRELGGYRTSDGRTVRHGLIWRGGSLGWLDAGELDRVRQIGFRCDLDFRSAIEADEMPDPRLPGVIYERSCAMLDARGDEIDFSPEGIARILEAHREVRGIDALDHLEDGSSDTDMFSPKALAVMDDIYVSMAFDSTAYRRLFAHLVEEEVPIVFHCTAGKDRTGVAAMLVLLALGVSEQMGRRVFDAIIARYGTYEAYFDAEYGLDAQALATLRDRYTEWYTRGTSLFRPK